MKAPVEQQLSSTSQPRRGYALRLLGWTAVAGVLLSITSAFRQWRGEGSCRRVVSRSRFGQACVGLQPAEGRSAQRTALAPDRDYELASVQYSKLVDVIVAIFAEFWQTNAFFTAFASISSVGVLSSWEEVAAAPAATICSIALGFLYLMGVWFITLFRHLSVTTLHISHAMELEAKYPALCMFHRRQRLPPALVSIRRLWLSVPIGFSVATWVVVVVALRS